MIGKELVLIKPDGVQRHLVGEIISRFERAGLSIDDIKMVKKVSNKLAAAHYSPLKEHQEKIYNRAVKHLQSGPIIAIKLISFSNTPFVVRKIVGSTFPDAALPGTIRGDFASFSSEYCDEKNIAIPNLVHASSSNEDAIREIKLWFD